LIEEFWLFKFDFNDSLWGCHPLLDLPLHIAGRPGKIAIIPDGPNFGHCAMVKNRKPFLYHVF
jgi:hypothetical protein